MRRSQPKFHQKCHTQSRNHKPKTKSKLAGQKLAIKGAQAKTRSIDVYISYPAVPIQNPIADAIPHEVFFHCDVFQQLRLVARVSLVLRRSGPEPDGSTARRVEFQHKMQISTLLPCMSKTSPIWSHRFCFIVPSRPCDATCADRYRVLKHCDAKCADTHCVFQQNDAN